MNHEDKIRVPSTLYTIVLSVHHRSSGDPHWPVQLVATVGPVSVRDRAASSVYGYRPGTNDEH